MQPDLTSHPERVFPLSMRIFIVLLAGAALAGFLLDGCGKKPKSQEPEESLAPAVPAFQDLVVFASSGQLYITNLAGDPAQSLLLPEKNLWFPAVSPDNTSVAYWSKASGAFELWIYDLATRRSSQITFFNDNNGSPDFANFNLHNAPAWSTDARTLAFSRGGKIWTVERNGFNLETLLSDGVRYAPSWSPAGDQLAYVSVEGSTQNLFLWNRLHRIETRLTNFPAGNEVGSPAWSPDGSQIAFTLASGERVDVWVINPDGSGLKRMTKDGYSNSPAWSPDSARLVFSSGRQDPYHWDIWMMNRDASRQFSITRNGGFSPAWLHVPYQTALRLQAKEFVAAATPAPTAAPTPRNTAVVAVQPTSMPTAVPTFAPTPRPTIAAAKAQPTPQPARTTAPTPKPQTTATQAVVVKAPTLAPTAKPVQPAATPAKTETAVAVPTAGESGGNYEAYEEYADEDKAVVPQDDLTMETQGNETVFRIQLKFFFAKDMIKSGSLPNLKRLAEQLEKYPEAALVVSCRAAGPKWLRGVLPLVRSLSRARANAVLQHLIVVEKIPQINVSAIGEGDPFPDLGLDKKRLVLVKVE